MADLSKLKGKKGRFGAIPEPVDTENNLKAPEHAPSKNTKARPAQKARGKTGRTETFGTRVSTVFIKEFKETAFLTDLKNVELLEDMLRVYRTHKGFNTKR